MLLSPLVVALVAVDQRHHAPEERAARRARLADAYEAWGVGIPRQAAATFNTR